MLTRGSLGGYHVLGCSDEGVEYEEGYDSGAGGGGCADLEV